MENSERFFQTTIGQVVKAWRQKRGLTVTALAQQAGGPITKGYISQLEHDKIRQPSDEHLRRLATALGITVQELVTRQMPDRPQDRGGRALRTRGMAAEPFPRAPIPEMNAEAIAGEVTRDPDLHAAYSNLKRALADPQMRPTVLAALAAFAQAARPQP